MAQQIKNVIRSTAILTNNSSRAFSSGVFNGIVDSSANKNQTSNKLHLAVQREYPQAERLPIPPNIDVAEATRFSPLRNRDINATAIDVKDESIIDVTLDQNKAKLQSMITYEDPHLNFYDAQSAVNIGSVMQSTVPEPYGGNNRHTHLNMPGGSWGLQTKYLSHELNSSHYTQLRQDIRSNETKQKGISMSMCGMIKAHLLPTHSPFLTINKRFISLSCSNRAQDLKGSQGESDTPKPVESNKEKLKRAVKEYGSTVIIFHVGISLMSLGMFYALVSSGLDVVALLEYLNIAEKFPKLAENASTFVIAYAIHKVFAPVRISITLGSTPFIVRFLRKKGILKVK